MANFLSSFFQQLDRAFPLQGAVHPSHEKVVRQVAVEQDSTYTHKGMKISPLTGYQMLDDHFDVMGNSAQASNPTVFDEE